MRVDGFRFDLASALSRTGQTVDMASPLMIAIGQDPTLRHVKLIAEPWDISVDGYRVGEFPRRGSSGTTSTATPSATSGAAQSSGIRTVATRLAGSSDLYADDGRSPYASVNFVTAHDGFTLRDLVTYEGKHNEANGEGNRDGSYTNRSQNFGVEGETGDAEIAALRRRTAANLLVTLCLSNGVPMITAGDERGRTQGGNNNPYVQDNEISWIDWRPDDAWLDVYDITKAALRLRREHSALRQRHWFEGRPTIDGGRKDLTWVHPEGREMTGDDWADNELSVVGMLVTGSPLRSPGPRGEQQWRQLVPDLAERRGRRREGDHAHRRLAARRRGRGVDLPRAPARDRRLPRRVPDPRRPHRGGRPRGLTVRTQLVVTLRYPRQCALTRAPMCR